MFGHNRSDRLAARRIAKPQAAIRRHCCSGTRSVQLPLSLGTSVAHHARRRIFVMPTSSGSYLPQDMLDCIELCNDCHKACLETAMYCLQQGGKHAEPNHVRLMFDCAEICQTSSNFMQRGSDLH